MNLHSLPNSLAFTTTAPACASTAWRWGSCETHSPATTHDVKPCGWRSHRVASLAGPSLKTPCPSFRSKLGQTRSVSGQDSACALCRSHEGYDRYSNCYLLPNKRFCLLCNGTDLSAGSCVCISILHCHCHQQCTQVPSQSSLPKFPPKVPCHVPSQKPGHRMGNNAVCMDNVVHSGCGGATC